MHIKSNSETPIQYSFWSACIALVTVFAVLDATTGGLLKESFMIGTKEYAVTLALVIATVGVYASDGSLGLKFVRACSRHKL